MDCGALSRCGGDTGARRRPPPACTPGQPASGLRAPRSRAAAVRLWDNRWRIRLGHGLQSYLAAGIANPTAVQGPVHGSARMPRKSCLANAGGWGEARDEMHQEAFRLHHAQCTRQCGGARSEAPASSASLKVRDPPDVPVNAGMGLRRRSICTCNRCIHNRLARNARPGPACCLAIHALPRCRRGAAGAGEPSARARAPCHLLPRSCAGEARQTGLAWAWAFNADLARPDLWQCRP
jgi:hypothetical protein